jgi:hypothetical protein
VACSRHGTIRPIFRWSSREGASLQSHGGGRFTAPVVLQRSSWPRNVTQPYGRPRRPEKKRSQRCLESIASLNDRLLGETSPGHRPAAAFATGDTACSPRILGIGAVSGHHEHRSPRTRVATDARGRRSPQITAAHPDLAKCSRALRIAGLSGFLTLSQSRDGPDWQRRPRRTNISCTQPGLNGVLAAQADYQAPPVRTPASLLLDDAFAC